MPEQAMYEPGVFDVPDVEAAKAIILTPEAGMTPDERWRRETDWLMEQIRVEDGDIVIDYGCGIGRLSKRLCEKAFEVFGYDISENMRAMALDYVGSSRFTALAPHESVPYSADFAVCVWVLQHVLEPEAVIGKIYDELNHGGALYVVNRENRCVPATADGQTVWVDDKKDITTMLLDRFECMRVENMPLDLCAPGAQFWELVKK